jgi:hypothetical protein
VVLAVSSVALTAACAAQPDAVPVGQVASAAPTATPTLTPTPTPTADPAMFTTVCADATQATSTATIVINDQLAILEQAAADGDQTRMVAAAEAINNQFTVLSASFTLQAQMLTSPPLSATLTDVSAALAEMASPRYTGTMVDIKKKMIDFAAAFAAVCP